jgi:hypothetical protein
MGRISLRLVTIITAALALALPAGANALSTPIQIGTNTMGGPTHPAVAVDSGGTAYIAWVVPTTPTQMDFCKVALGATGCSPVALSPPPATSGSSAFFDPPSVILSGADVYVFEAVAGAASNHLNGIDEWVSTDGGGSFTRGLYSVGYLPGEQTQNPVIALPGSNFGVGAVDPGGNPVFQANSLTSPSDNSAATTPPFATLNPSPNNYSIGNLGGQFALQPTGAEGVLGVFTLIEAGPCPSTIGLAYSFASLPASNATLSSTAGWHPLAGVDCNTELPAVGGGPSGLGLLETNETPSNPELVQYRRFTPPSTFGAPVTLASNAAALSPSVSQDGAGGVYATWIDNNTGVNLAYSPTGGASWYGPVSLLGNDNGALSIGSMASSVDSSGIGWAAYAANGREYAQPFDAQYTIPAPKKPANTLPPVLGGTAKAGKKLTCSAGSWTGNPILTYQWYRNGTLLAGVIGSTYTVGTIDEGSTFKCVVVATNAQGTATATSNSKKVPVPFVKRCPAATGKMTGTSIGLLDLRMTRTRARYVYRRHSNRGKQYQDFFCLTPMGVRAGYATPKLLRGLAKHERKAVNGHVVWASTSNPFYELDGVRAGESILTASKALGTSAPFHIGKNYWYLARKHGFTAVLKVRGVVVEELGIADNALTKTRKAQSVLMHSFY